MSWQDIEPTHAAAGKAPAPVKISVSKPSNRYQQRVTILIRPALLEGVPPFLKSGGHVRVQRGDGDHAGMLRLTAGTTWRLTRATGKHGGDLITLRLPPPFANAALQPVKPMVVDFDYGEDWLEVTMPALSSIEPVAPAAAPISIKAPDRPAATPYIGVTARVPDPAIKLQQQSGRRVR